MKQLMELQKKMKKKQDELRNIHIEAEESGVTVVINGEMEVVDIRIADDAMENKKKLQENIMKALQKGMAKAKAVAAENMNDIMKDMGLGGMMGGNNPLMQ